MGFLKYRSFTLVGTLEWGLLSIFIASILIHFFFYGLTIPQNRWKPHYQTLKNIYFFKICTVINIRLVFKHIFYLVNNLNNTTNIITIIIIVQSNMSLDQNFWENNCINLKCWKTRNEKFFLCYWKRVRDEKKCFT